MSFVFENRPSDVPLVEYIWQARSRAASNFVSTAESHWEMVITTRHGQTLMTVRGPETHAARVQAPSDAQHLGIVFKMGTFMPHLPLQKLINRQDKNLPQAGSQSFWLYGTAWQYPSFENADTFIAKLVHEGILTFDPIVESVLEDQPLDLSLRTVQRRFVNATGITHKMVQQIERARLATNLLMQGKPILDTAFEVGYYDQSHLTNAITRFMGHTPAQIAAEEVDAL